MNSVLPINPSRSSNHDLVSAAHILTMGVRVGDNLTSVGYITKINRTHTRNVTHLWQLEPYADGTFSSGLSASNFGTDVNSKYPKSNYFPGEAVEVVPGPLQEESIEISRYILYTSTMFEAFVRANKGEDLHKGSRLVSLLQQVEPIDVYEFWVDPRNGKIIYGIRYIECWFTDMGHAVEIGRDSVIAEDAKLSVRATRPYPANVSI